MAIYARGTFAVLLLATAQATYGIYFDSNGKPTPAKISW